MKAKNDEGPTLAMVWIGVAVLALVFVPPSLFGWDPSSINPRLMGAQLVGGVSLCVIGLFRFFSATKDQAQERRRGVRALVLFVILGIVAVAGIFGIYAYWWDAGGELCNQGERAASLEERRALLAQAEPYRDGIGFFNEELFSCAMLEDELDALQQSGECPRFIPLDAECTCGDLVYPADSNTDEMVRCSPHAEDGNTQQWTFRPMSRR